MKTKKLNFTILTTLIIASVLAFIQISLLKNSWFGFILTTVIFGGAGKFWHDILAKVFRIRRNKYTTYILGVLVSLLIYGFVLSFFVIFYKLSRWTIPIVILFSSLGSFYLNKFVVQNKKRLKRVKNDFEPQNYLFFTSHYSLFILYGLIWLLSAYFLVTSGSEQILHSPWLTIEHGFIYSFFALTLILVSLLLSKHRSKWVLLAIIAHSLLLHAYLPLSHSQPWGGDVWRHISFEKILLEYKTIYPTLIGEKINYINLGFLSIPELFTHMQKFSYSFTWSILVSFAKILQISLVELHKWLMPLIWSISIPVIFFQIGVVLFKSIKKSLWLAFFSLIPFSLQALGSITLPVSFGYLSFFLFLLLWILFLKDRHKWQQRILFGFSFLMLFGYSLHALLVWLLIGLTYLWQSFSKLKNKIISVISKTSALFLSIIAIPAIEILFGFSNFKEINVYESIIDFLKLLSGWKFTKNILAQDTLVGNILINHPPNYAFVNTIFTTRRYHVFLFLVLLLIAAGVGVYKIIKSKRDEWKSISILFSISFFGYFISWYFLTGDRILARRLNGLLAFNFILVALLGVWKILAWVSKKISKEKIKAVLVFILLLTSLFTITSYISGPDMRVVSSKEITAAKYIWSQDSERKCILANTWVLLKIRALSKNKVVGGGFPIGKQFSQPERVRLYKNMIDNPDRKLLKQAHKLTGSDNCWLVIPRDKISDDKIKKINTIMKSKPDQIEDFAIWNEGR